MEIFFRRSISCLRVSIFTALFNFLCVLATALNYIDWYISTCVCTVPCLFFLVWLVKEFNSVILWLSIRYVIPVILMMVEENISFITVILTTISNKLLMTLWKIFAVDTQFKQLRKRSLKKNSGFSGIRTRDLCDTGAVLYQLSYEAMTVGSRSILVGPSCH